MRTFYHNLTTGKFNLDISDCIESMTSIYNRIVYTVAGNAIIKELSEEMRERICILFTHFNTEKDDL